MLRPVIIAAHQPAHITRMSGGWPAASEEFQRQRPCGDEPSVYVIMQAARTHCSCFMRCAAAALQERRALTKKFARGRPLGTRGEPAQPSLSSTLAVATEGGAAHMSGPVLRSPAKPACRLVTGPSRQWRWACQWGPIDGPSLPHGDIERTSGTTAVVHRVDCCFVLAPKPLPLRARPHACKRDILQRLSRAPT